MWYTIDPDAASVANGRIHYRYGSGYLHDGEGVSIVSFVDSVTGEDYAFGIEGQYQDGRWDATPVRFGEPVEAGNHVDIPVVTGQTTKIDRLYRDEPVLEIIYDRNDSEWTEDFIRGPGAARCLAFVMHGLDNVIGLESGRRLWRETEARFGHNHGDHFLEVAGSSVTRCTYRNHLIYGVVSLESGHGVGFVYPATITVHDWKVWWTEERKLEIEYAPRNRTHRRWVFAVSDGRTELMEVGMRLAARGRP